MLIDVHDIMHAASAWGGACMLACGMEANERECPVGPDVHAKSVRTVYTHPWSLSH